MSWLQVTTARIRGLFGRSRAERELDDEVRFHLEMQIEDNLRVGMDPAEARRAALLGFGGMEPMKEEYREQRALAWLESVVHDVRYGVRMLAKSPGFTLVAVLTLALGIGANSAIFTLIDALMLRLLPVEKAEELFHVAVVNPKTGSRNGEFSNVLWEQLRERQDVFAGMAAWDEPQFNLAHGGAVNYASGFWVSGDFFSTLQVRPAAGRLIVPADDHRGCAGVAVLSYDFWQQHYGGAASAVGSAISLNSHSFEVVGVAPRGFHGLNVGRTFDVALPLCTTVLFDDASNRRLEQRGWSWLQVVGRARPGVTPAQVNARLAAISPSAFEAALPPRRGAGETKQFLRKFFFATPAGSGISPLRQQFRNPLQILMALVGMVLLIACANVAALMLARGAAQSREIAVRLALGASRMRLVRQLLTHCLLLAAAGALAGALFAQWGTALLVRYLSTSRNSVFLDIAPDRRVFTFTAAVAVLTGILFGVLPAFRSTRVPLTLAMRGSAAQTDARSPLRKGIVASQVGLSLVLLVVAGLFLRSFSKLVRLDAGFERENVLLARVDLRRTTIPREQRLLAYEQAEQRLRAVPGVVSAGYCMMTPIGDSNWRDNVVPDTPNPPTGDAAESYFNSVSPGHFPTLRMALLAGRNFNGADNATAPPVAIVNRTFARRFFPGGDAIGHTIRVGEISSTEDPVRIVGVVADAKYRTLREELQPTAFFPAMQDSGQHAMETFEIRTAVPPSAVLADVQAAITGVDKQIPIEFNTLSQQVDDSLVRERLLAMLSAFFGAIALLLAMVGLYGTISYLVTLRQAEFGIRMALGAQVAGIVKLVLREVAMIVGAGVAVGIAISLAAASVVQKLLFGLGPRDATTIMAAALLLAATALLAGYLPARRAARVDPMIALRYE